MIAAISIVCLLVISTTSYAAANGELFSRIWGNLGKDNIDAHEELIWDEEKETFVIEQYPKREYADTAPEQAEDVLGDKVEYPSFSQEIAGTKMTILSAVRDDKTAVVAYTLEKEGGVDALVYSQNLNEAKGAFISEESMFYYTMGIGGLTYVDLDKSTDDKLYCYDYILVDEKKEEITLWFEEYPCVRKEIIYERDDEKFAEIIKNTKSKTLRIPVSQKLESVTYINEFGGRIELSPISMTIDMRDGHGLESVYSSNGDACKYIAINYIDGSHYVVWEHEVEGSDIYTEEIDNSAYNCSLIGEEITYLLNRLVNLKEVESITVNDLRYTLQ